MMSYTPQPIDTKGVQLSHSLLQLTELLAKNVHDIWALQRMEQGWTYGAERNDALKHNPCLIPYEYLPDEEKEYDRKTSMETLKVIQSLGYRIKKV